MLLTAELMGQRVFKFSPVGGADDEDVLLGAHTVHLGQDLVDDTIRSAAGVTDVPTTRLGDGVQLVEEENAWCRLPRLVEST